MSAFLPVANGYVGAGGGEFVLAEVSEIEGIPLVTGNLGELVV